MSIAQSGVYAIKGPNDCVYIGSTVNADRRWEEHKRALRKGCHHSKYLQRAWDKHGMNAFEFILIEPVPSNTRLIRREQVWIDAMLSTLPRRYLYNTSPTAGRALGVKRTSDQIEEMRRRATGKKQSAETIQKRANKLRGIKRPLLSDEERDLRHRARVRSEAERQKEKRRLLRESGIVFKKPRLGISHTPETRAKLSAAHTGKVITLDQANKTALSKSGGKIYVIVAPNGTQYDGVVNVSSFAQEHGIRGNLLRSVLRGERAHTQGWYGWIKGESPKIPAYAKYTLIDPNGIVYTDIVYVQSFAREHGLTNSAVWRVLKGIHKQHKGWTGFIQGDEL